MMSAPTMSSARITQSPAVRFFLTCAISLSSLGVSLCWSGEVYSKSCSAETSAEVMAYSSSSLATFS